MPLPPCTATGAGGSGLPAGLTVIALSTLAGIAGHYLAGRRPDNLWQIAAMSGASTLAMMIGMMVLPVPSNTLAFTALGMSILALTFAAAYVSSLIILQGRRLSDERRLMFAAMQQSPDYQYVKNRLGQFVVVNQNVAESYGFTSSNEMRGLTDYDVAPPENAKLFFANEHAHAQDP